MANTLDISERWFWLTVKVITYFVRTAAHVYTLPVSTHKEAVKHLPFGKSNGKKCICCAAGKGRTGCPECLTVFLHE
jgi:hypothetical protein